MQAAVLILFLMPGANAQIVDVSVSGTMAAAPAGQGAAAPAFVYSGGSQGASSRPARWLEGVFSPMPQSCYQPRYGCYSGASRFTHRYPAFHGTFYRRPYNYRNYFDYPWHATLHEPTSHFSFNVPREQRVSPRDAAPIPPIPAVPPMGVQHRGNGQGTVPADTARRNAPRGPVPQLTAPEPPSLPLRR